MKLLARFAMVGIWHGGRRFGTRQVLKSLAESSPVMPAVVLDSNALMMPFQFGLNLSAEIERLLGHCEMYVPAGVMSELRSLSKKERAAKAGLKLAERFKIAATEASGDEAILEAASALGAVVVTNDAELLEKLKAMGIRRIRLRSKSHLVLEGD